MARETKTREIGACRYRVTQLKARAGHRVLERIARTILPALGAAADNLGAEEAQALVGDLAKGGISDAVSKLVSALEEDSINWLVDAVRESVEYQTPELQAAKPGAFVPMGPELWDDHFAGSYLAEFKLIAFVLEVNFEDFFAGLGGVRGAFSRFVTPTRSPSNSPPTETPGSGASS